VRKRGKLACSRTSRVGWTIGWSVFVLVAPCSVGPVTSIGGGLSLGRRFASCFTRSCYLWKYESRVSAVIFLAVDFVRKTVYHRQASLCTWLESYTVTANSFYPAPFACFLCLLAVHSHTLRCIRADLTAIFAVTRFSKLPVPPSCCSDSIAYARIGGRCAGQSAPVRPQLCNQLCNSRPTTAYNYDVLAHTSGEALSAPSSRIPRLV
jgi:hypothetical protein